MAASRGVGTLVDECRSALAELPAEWSLTPVKGKKPYRPRWAEEAPVDRDLIADEIARGHASGFALRTGSPSGGIFAIDEDGPGSLDLLPEPPGGLPRSVSAISGRLGHSQRFLAVAAEDWPVIRNRTVFATPTGVKLALRFDSMISVLPPSLHPHSRRYLWAPGLSPGEIAPAPAPGSVLGRARYDPGEAGSIVDAAWRGDRRRVAAALAAGIDPDHPAADGHTALERAVWGGHVECSRLLIAAGSNLARPDPEQGSPLILAAAQGEIEIVAALLEAGAPVAQRDAAGRTALHAACWGGHAGAAELLAAAGADSRARDVSGGLPSDEARRWGYAELTRWAEAAVPAAPTRSRRAAGA